VVGGWGGGGGGGGGGFKNLHYRTAHCGKPNRDMSFNTRKGSDTEKYKEITQVSLPKIIVFWGGRALGLLTGNLLDVTQQTLLFN